MPIIIHKYTPSEFLKARVIRLYPVLAVMTLVTLSACYLVQMPGEYQSTAVSAIFSSFFLSFAYFFNYTGYFDIAAGMQPLLHTWSLGIEFCAYILLFFILTISRLKSYLLRVSFLLCLTTAIFVFFKGDINYFDPVSRFFLFFSGVFYSTYIQNDQVKIGESTLRWVSILATISFVLLMFLSDSDLEWPNGLIIVMPFIALPLMHMTGRIVPFRWLASLLKHLGDWSYSLYIWHWPIIVLFKLSTRQVSVITWDIVILLFTLSIVVGAGSYYLLEKRKIFGKKSLYTLFILCLVIATSIWNSGGATKRIDPQLVKYYYLTDMIAQKKCLEVINQESIEFCLYSNKPNSEKVLIVGDSHAKHFLPILDSSAAISLFHAKLQPDTFAKNISSIERFISNNNISKLLVAYQFNNKGVSKIDNMLGSLQSNLLPILIIQDVPSHYRNPVACYLKENSSLFYRGCHYQVSLGLPISDIENKHNLEWSNVIKVANISAMNVIETHSALCDDYMCKTILNDEFLMRDKTHFNERLSLETNEILYSLIFKKHL